MNDKNSILVLLLNILKQLYMKSEDGRNILRQPPLISAEVTVQSLDVSPIILCIMLNFIVICFMFAKYCVKINTHE